MARTASEGLLNQSGSIPDCADRGDDPADDCWPGLSLVDRHGNLEDALPPRGKVSGHPQPVQRRPQVAEEKRAVHNYPVVSKRLERAIVRTIVSSPM